MAPATCTESKSSTPTISDFPRPRPIPRALPRPLPRPASISTQSVYPVDCRAFVETMTGRLVSIPTNGRCGISSSAELGPCSLGGGHITSCHGSKTYCLIFLYRYHWRSLSRPAETMGGGGSCGRFPFPVNNWKASTLLSGADFAKTTPGSSSSFFSLFHQRADDEALTRFLQTSLCDFGSMGCKLLLQRRGLAHRSGP